MSAEELRSNWAKTPIGVFPFSEAMVPKSGIITQQDIADDSKRWQVLYDAERKDALAHADGDIYALTGKTVAS